MDGREHIPAKQAAAYILAVLAVFAGVAWVKLRGPEKSPPEPVLKVDPAAISAAYEANEVNGDQIYRGKLLELSVAVGSISKETLGDGIHMTFEPGKGDLFASADCTFDKRHAPAIAKLRRGQKVVVIGRGDGTSMGRPMLEGCRLISVDRGE